MGNGIFFVVGYTPQRVAFSMRASSIRKGSQRIRVKYHLKDYESFVDYFSNWDSPACEEVVVSA